MCQFRSAVAVYNSTDDTVTLRFLAGQDSHTRIREQNGIRDDGSPGASRQTSLEYVPTDLLNLDSYQLQFDAERPDWWTEEHTVQAVRQFQADITPQIAARRWEWGGDLDLRSLTALPEGVTLSAGGYLDLRSLTALPEGVTLKAGGGLYLNSLTALPEGVTLKAGGGLYLNSLTALPEGVTLSAGGDLYLSSLTALPEGVTLKAGAIYYGGSWHGPIDRR